MQNIVLADNQIIRLNLIQLRERTWITLNMMNTLIGFVEKKHFFPYLVKFFILEMILEDEVLCKKDAYQKCRQHISYGNFNYPLFCDIFAKIKKYAEKGLSFRDIAGASREIRHEKLFWPGSREKQERIKKIMFDYNNNFQTRINNLPREKVIASEIRMIIVTELSQKKIINKTEAIMSCQRSLGNDFELTIFKENWLYLQNFFSIKVAK